MLADKIAPFYFVTWGILAIALVLFNRYASIATRRRWHGYVVGGAGIVIGIFMLVMSVDRQTFPYVALLIVTLISWMTWTSYRKTRFCLGCNVTYNVTYVGFQPPAYCPKCGKPTVGV